MGQLASGGDVPALKVEGKLKGFVAQGKPLLPDRYALASACKGIKGELNPLAGLRRRPVALLALTAFLLENS